MIIKIDSLKNKAYKRWVEHIFYLAITFILIPSLFYFELCVVLPVVVTPGSLIYFMHFFCATFLLHNITGNLMYGMFTSSSIKGQFLHSVAKDNWSVCTVCECRRPPRAWHCNICDICILKRDHHCTFFACCVGYYNHRYFMLFTFYIFIAMVYAFYFNVKFLALFITWNHGLVLVKFMFPLASFVIDYGYESLYVFLVVVNVIVGCFTGFLFFYHLNNLLKGKVVPETKHSTKDFQYDRGIINNIIEVFGKKWYLTWLSPFVQSPLPGNGIEWIDDNKYK